MRAMRTASIAVMLLGASVAARAGDVRVERTATWESVRPGRATERTNRRETLWIGEGRLRCDDRVGRETWIVRADLKVIWRIDHALRTYEETTFEEAAKARAAAAADVRAALARAEGSGDEPALRRLLESLEPEAAGCEAVTGADGGDVAGRATKAVAVEPKAAPAVKGRLSPGAPGMDRLAGTLAAAGLLPAPVAAALAKAAGLLMSGTWTLAFPDRIVRETFEVTKVEELPAPEGTWDLPAGCRKVASRLLGRAPHAVAAPPGGHEGDPPGSEREPADGPKGEEAGRDQ